MSMMMSEPVLTVAFECIRTLFRGSSNSRLDTASIVRMVVPFGDV